jgi:hypothetical protein
LACEDAGGGEVGAATAAVATNRARNRITVIPEPRNPQECTSATSLMMGA